MKQRTKSIVHRSELAAPGALIAILCAVLMTACGSSTAPAQKFGADNADTGKSKPDPVKEDPEEEPTEEDDADVPAIEDDVAPVSSEVAVEDDASPAANDAAAPVEDGPTSPFTGGEFEGGVVGGPGCTPAATPLDRKGWIAGASSSFTNGEQSTPEKMLDGDLGTRWASGVEMADDVANPQRIIIDMLSTQTVCQFVMSVGGGGSDYPRKFDVYVSDSPKPTEITYSGTASANGDLKVTLPKVAKGRYLAIVNRGSAPPLWWTVSELNVSSGE